MGTQLQKILYEAYLKSLGKEVIEVVERYPPEEGQVRLFFLTPPEWVLVVRRISAELFALVPLTSYLQLAITDRYPPLVKWRGRNFVPLPLWFYSRREIIERFSKPVFRVEEIEKIRDYVKSARTKGIGNYREKFIKKVAERFSDITLSSMVWEVMEAEGRIKFPQDLAEELLEREELQLAAKTGGYLKGKNWLGAVEGNRLILYLPENLIGKRIRIKLEGRILYEGLGLSRLILEDLPELPSYSFMEESLHVQILDD